MQRLTEHLGEFVVHRRLGTWALIVAVTVTSGFGWSGYRLLERRPSPWIPTDEEAALREARDTFEFGESPYVLVIESEDFFQPRRIAVLRSLASFFEQVEPAGSVLWIGKIPKVEGLQPTPLLPPPDAPPEAYRRAREEFLRHPLAAGQLLSRDGKTMLMLMNVRLVPREVRRIVQEACEGSGMRVRVTGFTPLWEAQREAFNEDHSRIVLVACILVFVLAIVIFRGLSAMLVVSSGPMLGLVWAWGLLELFGQTRGDLVQIIVPVMILMIGFADGVHLVVHVRQARAAGMDPREAAQSAVRHVGRACALTSLTTAVGFGSLMISGSAEIRGFGRSAAIGVLITFAAVILVIPLLSSSWLGRRIHLGHQRDLVGRAVRRFSWLTDAVVAHARWVAAGGAVLTALLAAGALTLRPDDRVAYVTPHTTEAYQAMAHVDRAFGGIQFVEVLLEWPQRASHDEIWQVLDRAEKRLAEEPLIQAPLSIRQWLSLLPGEESAAKLAMADLLPKQYRDRFWHPSSRRALVVARVQDLGIVRYGPVVERVRTGLAELERQHAGFRLELTGHPIVRGREIQRLVRDLARSLALAAGVIFVVLSVAYRSIRIGLISVVPNLFPLVATGALRAAWDTSLDIASACSFTICLGIAVDDTIHFLTRFQHERRNGHDVAAAIRQSFMAVGSALVMTTVVMIAGLGTVLTSQLPTHQAFAAMGCMTLGAALLGDLIILPALLVCFPLRSRRS